MNRLVPITLAFVVALSTLSATHTVSAQTDEEMAEAMRLYENGVRLFEDEEYQFAIEAFERSYVLSQQHALLFNLALTAEMMGDYDLALEYLNRYRIYIEEDNREELEARVSRVRGLIAEREAAEVEAETDTEVTSEGVELDPVDIDQDGDTDAPDASEEEVADTNTADTDGDVIADAPEEQRGLNTGQWFLVGTTSAALISGIAFGILSRDILDDIAADCEEVSPGQLVCSDAENRMLEDENRLATIADVSFGLAMLSAIGLGLTFVIQSEQDLEVAVQPTGDGGIVRLSGSF